jgi:SAM-dependent methyltransferase
MQTTDEIKKVVKEKYGEIAKNNSSCCGPTSCCGTDSKVIDYSIVQDDYTGMDGYVPAADLGLGCGLPTEFAGIKKGDTVVDLGSGAGNDVFVARALTGDEGKVIGLDFTQEMIDKANQNKVKVGFTNVEFKLGEIEDMPLENDTADVIVSNCVLNLVPDKVKAFAEMYRVTKPGGHFCVSDIVLKGELPEGLQKSAAMYAGCVAGAIQQEDYLGILEKTGFKDVEIKKTKAIELPDNVLKNYLTVEELNIFKENKIGIFSITVVGYKQ